MPGPLSKIRLVLRLAITDWGNSGESASPVPGAVRIPVRLVGAGTFICRPNCAVARIISVSDRPHFVLEVSRSIRRSLDDPDREP
jgi:hypothetical protein